VESRVLAALTEEGGTVEQIAESIGAPDASENVYLLLEHLAANGRARVVETGAPAARKFARG
jgi:glucose-6-phosphate isomerase